MVGDFAVFFCEKRRKRALGKKRERGKTDTPA